MARTRTRAAKRALAADGGQRANKRPVRSQCPNDDYAPACPYEHGLSTMRAANTTPAVTFEDQYKAVRLRELYAEGARLALHIAAIPFPRLSVAEAAELATYAPPDPAEAASTR